MQVIAALYVAKNGCYFGLPGVDPWDEERDARTYAGPGPVVAHPPCQRWGRYWSGGPSAKVRRTKGDDGGCFAAALASVRTHGGVLEHPEASHAFKAHGLWLPPYRGGWVAAGDGAGYVCCVPQGNYGHRSRKLTWLYAVGAELPELNWTHPVGMYRMDDGHCPDRTAVRRGATERLTHAERLATPVPFRDLLLSIARSCR